MFGILEQMTESVIQADCLEYLKTLPDNSLDAVVTDPPYELGFMGKTWDNTGIANSVELWSQVLRVLKPGGHLLSFGGTRTYHRMASAIEDAGFEVRDMVEWVYGSGFPKSLNIGKAVDKLQGNERKTVGLKRGANRLINQAPNGRRNGNGTWGNETGRSPYLDKGTSEWEGWGTALKPAHEPIVLARKPIEKGLSVAENCLKWGTGGIDIDGSRVSGEITTINILKKWSGFGQEKQPEYKQEINSSGRFPANLIHDNSEEVRECFPEAGNGWKRNYGEDYRGKQYGGGSFGGGGYLGNSTYADSGNASRFFKSILYYPKASKKERNEGMEESRNTHPTVKPVALMEYLIQMVTKQGQTILDPFAGSGTTLVAAFKTGRGYIGIEKEEQYIPIINARLEGCKKSGATIPLCLTL